MALYRNINGKAVKWSGESIDGIKHPRNIEKIWSEKELNSIGLYFLVKANPPKNKKVIDKTVIINDGIPTEKLITKNITITKEDVINYRNEVLNKGTNIEIDNMIIGFRQSDIYFLINTLTSKKDKFTFKDKNEIIHSLTREQMEELWEKGNEWLQNVYEISWKLEDSKTIPKTFKGKFP